MNKKNSKKVSYNKFKQLLTEKKTQEIYFTDDVLKGVSSDSAEEVVLSDFTEAIEIIDHCYANASEVLARNIEPLRKSSLLLLEKEILEGEDLKWISQVFV